MTDKPGVNQKALLEIIEKEDPSLVAEMMVVIDQLGLKAAAQNPRVGHLVQRIGTTLDQVTKAHSLSLFETPFLAHDGAVERIDEETVQSETDMYPNLGGGTFLHGADTMIPIIQTAEVLCPPGETIPQVKTLRWQQMMTRNLLITASTKRTPKTEDQVLTATLLTSGGREIYVSAILADNGFSNETEAPRIQNDFPIGIINQKKRIQPKGNNIYEIPMQRHRGFKELKKPFTQKSLLTTVFTELLNKTVAQIWRFQNQRDEVIIPQKESVMGGVRDVSFPDFKGLFENQGGKIRLEIAPHRQGVSRVSTQLLNRKNQELGRGSFTYVLVKK